MTPRTFARSEELLARAERSIPLGAQTFSKSRTQFPHGVSPFFVKRARGSRVWDADDHEYVDFVNGLLAVSLGHADPDVQEAVTRQLADGVTHSLSHPIEIEVAETLCKLVPCAERVRFGKNGSDATSAAIRIARAATGRDRVAVCGYHGWQDWYIGSTSRSLGVPAATQELTRTFRFNELETLDELLDTHPGEYAAVILEPMNVEPPTPEFLQGVSSRCRAAGAVLVFDETITGFRFALGGAQELFGVQPDLATFGKGLANGFPLSAVVGRADLMELMEEIFFSTTFAGETLSLAAARAVLHKLVHEPVLQTLASRGQQLIEDLRSTLTSCSLEQTLRVAGHPSWSFLLPVDTANATAWEIKTYLLQELFQRGILTLGTHNLSYAHTQADIEQLACVYREVLSGLADALDRPQGVRRALRCEPLVPLFSVR